MNEVEESFLNYFRDVKDPRSIRNRLYTIEELLFLTLSAVICGAQGWKDIERFGKARLDYLRKYFPYKSGSPSDDTVRRFFRGIDPNELQELFRNWVKSLPGVKEDKVIAIDGENSSEGSDGDGNILCMISAYVAEAKMVLCQEKVPEEAIK